MRLIFTGSCFYTRNYRMSIRDVCVCVACVYTKKLLSSPHTQLNYQMRNSGQSSIFSCFLSSFMDEAIFAWRKLYPLTIHPGCMWINWLGVYSQWKIHLPARGNKFSHVEKRSWKQTLMDEPRPMLRLVYSDSLTLFNSSSCKDWERKFLL